MDWEWVDGSYRHRRPPTATGFQPAAPIFAETPLPALAAHEKQRLRSAAFAAARLYPGPVGEVLRTELLAWEDFGHRLGGNRLIMQLVDHVMAAKP